MIAKIGKGSNMYGVILYNQQKVDKENGAVLLLNGIPDTLDGRYSATYFNKCFEPYLLANIKTEKTVQHISLNPDPKDKVSDEQFAQIAQEYMERMGYSNQPYIVFKHTDIDRTHIHIVSTCVGIDGKKIPDDYDHPRSMAICRDLEIRYSLHKATDQEQKQADKIFKVVNYQKGDIKSQIASVVRYLPKYYSFSTLGGYNAIISQFNITVEEVKGERNGKSVNGLVYFSLNRNGEKVSNPFKASLFGKDTGIIQLQKHFEASKAKMKINPAKSILKSNIELALYSTNNEPEFKEHLREQGINVVVRKNETGRIYGITFIDHHSKTVWNGSQLAKRLSANTFNDFWNHNIKPEIKDSDEPKDKIPLSKITEYLPVENPHPMFKVDDANKIQDSLIDEFSGLFNISGQNEDYEEQDFENRMKIKRKRKR